MFCILNMLFYHPVSEATPDSKITGAYCGAEKLVYDIFSLEYCIHTYLRESIGRVYSGAGEGLTGPFSPPGRFAPGAKGALVPASSRVGPLAAAPGTTGRLVIGLHKEF
jgi:hypothetical protein